MLGTNRLGDIETGNGGEWTRDLLTDYLQHYLVVDSEGQFVESTAGGEARQVSIEVLHKAWQSILRKVPTAEKRALGGDNKPKAQYSSVAHKLMAAMGWRGGGLGKSGIADPVSIPGQTTRAGVGHAKGPRKPRPAAPVVSYGGVMGRLKGGKLFVVDLSARGHPVETGEVVHLDNLTHKPKLDQVVMWRGGILGVADYHYPHPAGWTIEGASEGATIDCMTVRALTAVYRECSAKPEKTKKPVKPKPKRVMPTCIGSWCARLRGDVHGVLPFHSIAMVYRNVLLTPKDYQSHFKNILHRRLQVRSLVPHEGNTTVSVGAVASRRRVSPT